MEIQKYLAGMKRKYEIILNFINKDNPTEKEFQEVRDLHQSNDFYKIQDLIETFRLIMSISNNYHRNSSFFANIEKIILYYKKEIQKHFSNTEIFDLFASNKKILLFLLKEKIITFDKYIFNTLNNFKFAQLGYKYYFSPELNLFHYSVPDEKHIEHAIEDQTNPEIFERKRLIGQNDDELCEIIRNDSLQDFISYIESNQIKLSQKVSKSIFETNQFLINKKPTLIEYASFFGSIQIFNYLVANGTKLTPSLWIYSVHSDNLEIIKILEKNEINPDDKTYNEVFIESIKCHHNNIAKYLQKVPTLNNQIEKLLKYNNFELLPSDMIDDSLFYNFCKYNYVQLADIFLKTKSIDVNELKETKKIKNNKREKIIKNETCLFAASKKGNIDIIKLLLSRKEIDVNKISSYHHIYFYKENMKEQTALNIAVEKEKINVVELLLSKQDININNKILSIYKNERFKQTEEKTSLYDAIEKENPEIVQLMLACTDIDVNEKFISKEEARYKNYIEKTPLFLAVEKRNLKIIKDLLSCKKIDINAITIEKTVAYNKERTVLHLATKIGDRQIYQLLLEHLEINLNINYIKEDEQFENQEDKKIKKIISSMVDGKDKDELNTLKIKKISEETVFHIAMKYQNMEIIQLLLARPEIDINCKTKEVFQHSGYSRYFFTIANGIPEFKLINENSEKVSEKSELHYAIEKKQTDIVKFLLGQPKIDVNAKCTFSSKGDEGERMNEDTPLNMAIQKKDLDMIKLLVSHPDIDINIQISFLETYKKSDQYKNLIHVKNKIFYQGYEEEEEEEEESKDQYEYKEQHTALHQAIGIDKNDIVEFLLTLPDIDVNAKSIKKFRKREIGFTPLHRAIEHGNIKMIKLLLRRPEIDVNIPLTHTKKDKETPLCMSIESGKDEIAKLLLERPEINVNAKSIHNILCPKQKSQQERTALHIAIQRGKVEIVKLLLERNEIDINALQTNINYSKEAKLIQTIKKTALHIAIQTQNIEIIQFLLEKPGIDINVNYSDSLQTDYNSVRIKPTLYMAVEIGNYNIVQLLLQIPDIDVNAKTTLANEKKGSFERTALHEAISKGNIEIIKLLLNTPKIDVNIKSILQDKDGRSEETSALYDAVVKENIELINLLLNAPGIDVNMISIFQINDGGFKKRTALHEAVDRENVEITKLLLDVQDIDINTLNIEKEYNGDTIDMISRTPLHIAIKWCNDKILKLLLSHKNIDVNAQYKITSKSEKKVFDISTFSLIKLEFISEEVKTALHMAVEQEYIDSIILLLTHPQIDVNAILTTIGVDVYQHRSKIYENDTALHIAVKKDNLEIIQLLLIQKTININIQDINGRKPSDCTDNNAIKTLFENYSISNTSQ